MFLTAAQEASKPHTTVPSNARTVYEHLSLPLSGCGLLQRLQGGRRDVRSRVGDQCARRRCWRQKSPASPSSHYGRAGKAFGRKNSHEARECRACYRMHEKLDKQTILQVVPGLCPAAANTIQDCVQHTVQRACVKNTDRWHGSTDSPRSVLSSLTANGVRVVIVLHRFLCLCLRELVCGQTGRLRLRHRTKNTQIPNQ